MASFLVLLKDLPVDVGFIPGVLPGAGRRLQQPSGLSGPRPGSREESHLSLGLEKSIPQFSPSLTDK